MSTGSDKIADGIAEVADEAEARATEDAQRQIEEAQRKADEAEALAKQLTDAALATELGRQISAVRNGVEQCRTGLTEQGQVLSALTQQLTELLVRIPQVSLTPPPSPPEGPPHKATEIPTSPDRATEESDDGDGPPVPESDGTHQRMARKRRRI